MFRISRNKKFPTFSGKSDNRLLFPIPTHATSHRIGSVGDAKLFSLYYHTQCATSRRAVSQCGAPEGNQPCMGLLLCAACITILRTGNWKTNTCHQPDCLPVWCENSWRIITAHILHPAGGQWYVSYSCRDFHNLGLGKNVGEFLFGANMFLISNEIRRQMKLRLKLKVVKIFAIWGVQI